VIVRVENLSPGRAPDDRGPDDLGIRMPDRGTALTLPGFTSDFGKVIARAGLLFPFLIARPAFERIVEPPRTDPNAPLGNPFARGPGSAARPPLELSDAAVQALADRSWSRRDRWNQFQPLAVLAQVHDPDAGRLADVLRAYVLQNGLQPFVEGRTRDPRLWTQLSIAADHADFIDFIAEYAAAHPSTRATTELLFQLDNLTQASLDALCTLIDTRPGEDLWSTQRARPDAYDALLTIRAYYLAALEARKLMTRRDLVAHFDNVRLAILERIVASTPGGYRAADAQFLIGLIYWKQQRRAEAVRAWSRISPGASDHYAQACAVLRPVLPAFGTKAFDSTIVDRVISNEHGRWVSFSYDRLKQFGYRFDTF
jgi:hypothetical protein